MTVLTQITRLASHYPNSGHTVQTLAVVAEDWFDEFKDMPEALFLRMIRGAMKWCLFFPTMADLTKSDKKDKRCDKCIYTKKCDESKKNRLGYGDKCDSCITSY